jgi:hypothetical protein
MKTMKDEVAAALLQTLVSPNVSDSNGEAANIVDAIDKLARNAWKIADAITPPDAAPGRDEEGHPVGSLTEAAMSISAALHRIADAVGDLASAVRDHAEK